jgi:hypothetical protein
MHRATALLHENMTAVRRILDPAVLYPLEAADLAREIIGSLSVETTSLVNVVESLRMLEQHLT